MVCHNYAATSQKVKLQVDVLLSLLYCYQNQKLLLLDALDQTSCQITTPRGQSRANYGRILSGERLLYLSLQYSTLQGAMHWKGKGG